MGVLGVTLVLFNAIFRGCFLGSFSEGPGELQDEVEYSTFWARGSPGEPLATAKGSKLRTVVGTRT